VGAVMVRRNASLLWGLLILRLGLGGFLALWSIDKFVSPSLTVDIFSRFYFLDLNPSLVMLIGAGELVLSLLIILGMYKTTSYALGLLVQAISTLSIYKELLSPFGKNHLFISSIPILFAFVALFLLRNFDTKWTLGKKKSIFT
jgi:putative oxidoreductase